MALRAAYNLCDKECFDETIQACVDTLNRNKDKIYNLLSDHTSEVKIVFNFKPDKIINMDIIWNKCVYEDEEKKSIKVKGEKENEHR